VSEIEDKVYNIELVVAELHEFPQTYESLLREQNKGTLHTILSRKINILINEGRVFKTAIPGTRFGKVIFYVYPKKYNILVETGRMGSQVYVFFECEHISKFYLKTNKYWLLNKGYWEMFEKEKIFFEGSILLMI